MKNKKIALCILGNTTLAALYIFLNVWALQAQLEETFIFLAGSYGLLTVFFNVLIVSRKEK